MPTDFPSQAQALSRLAGHDAPLPAEAIADQEAYRRGEITIEELIARIHTQLADHDE